MQNWGRKKKEALINSQFDELHKLAKCKNDSHYLLRSARLRSASEENDTSSAALCFARATDENIRATGEEET